MRRLKTIPVRRARAAAPGPKIMVRSPLFPRHPEANDDVHAVIRRLLGDREHGSKEELQAALAGLRASGALEAAMQEPAADPREEARRLAAKAYLATDDAVTQSLIEQALALDPENTDALLLPVPFNTPESLPRLREIVAMARGRLGERAFQEDVGQFWSLAETREYMRAHHKLALACFWGRQFDEAVVEFERLLELDQRDALAAREMLLPLYLRAKEAAKASALVAKFSGHESALWNWGIFLAATLFQEETAKRAALADAFRVNRLVPEYLYGLTKERPTLRSYYELGGDDEAHAAAVVLMPVVASDPEGTTTWFAELVKREAAK